LKFLSKYMWWSLLGNHSHEKGVGTCILYIVCLHHHGLMWWFERLHIVFILTKYALGYPSVGSCQESQEHTYSVSTNDSTYLFIKSTLHRSLDNFHAWNWHTTLLALYAPPTSLSQCHHIAHHNNPWWWRQR
jgi:hypothetical protein